MTTLFDGMASIMSGVLGGVVTVEPAVGSAFDLQAIFRESPIEVLDTDGRGVLVLAASLSVLKVDAALLSEGDIVNAPDGRQFEVVNGQPNGSIANDAEVVFELSEDLA